MATGLQDVQYLRETIGRVTRALTDSNIEVRQEGLKAHVAYNKDGQPQCVTLPSLPDDAPRDLMIAIQGFLDHEVAHLLFTDMKYVIKELHKKGKSEEKHAYWNILEDCQIEKRMADKFYGSGRNLGDTRIFAISRMIAPTYEKAVAAGAEQYKFAGILIAAAIRALYGYKEFATFMDGKWPLMGKVGTVLQSLEKEIKSINSTTTAVSVAQQIFDAMHDEGEGEEGEGEPSSGSGGGSKSASGKGGGKSSRTGTKHGKPEDKTEKEEGEKSKPKKSEKPKPEESEESDEPEGGDGEGSEEKDKPEEPEEAEKEKGSEESEEGDGGGDGGTGADDFDDDEEDEDDDEPNDGTAGLGGGSHEESAVASFDTKDVKDMDDTMSEAISSDLAAHLAKSPSKYLPYSRDGDYVGRLPYANQWDGKTLSGSKIPRQAESMSPGLQSEVERVFRARSAARWLPAQKKGKLHRAGLHKLISGDDRVFRTKLETTTKSVAVQLVIDASGSMSGGKIEAACVAAYIFATLLQRIGVPCEIVAFSTLDDRIADALGFKRASEVYKAIWEGGPGGFKYGRVEPLALYVLKEFKERFNDSQKKALAFMPELYGILRNNVDGESIEQAATRLVAQKEARKVMIVMSDGAPAAYCGHGLGSHLKKVIKEMERAGLEIYGLGLMDHSVKEFYMNSEVISRIEEIPERILALLKKIVVT